MAIKIIPKAGRKNPIKMWAKSSLSIPLQSVHFHRNTHKWPVTKCVCPV